MKRTVFSAVLVCSLLVAVLAIYGCGSTGSSGSTGSGSTGSTGGGATAGAVSLTPSSAQAIDEGQSLNITASVANDTASKGVTWTLTGPGSLSSQTSTSVTYSAGTSGTGNATVTATAVSNSAETAALNVAVSAAPTITTTSLAAGTEATAYNQTVVVSGGTGTKTYSTTSGSLPAGLTLNSSTGAITGTPTGPNTTANFTVKVTDSSSAGAQSATQALSIAINLPPAPQITTTTLPNGNYGTPYNQTIAVSGGAPPFTFSVTAGGLPGGLTLNTSTGAITGTPSSAQGSVPFTIMVADSSNPGPQTASQAYTVNIGQPLPLQISTTSLPAGTIDTPYSTTIAATGGVPPFTFSLDATSPALPNGLSLDSSTGTISGTPTASAPPTALIIDVHDNQNPAATAQATLTLTINLQPCPMGGNNGLLTGEYAFLAQGFDTNGASTLPFTLIGYFTADGNGNVTAGEVDLNADNEPDEFSAIPSGTYSVGPDNRGCVTFTYANAFTVNMRFAAGTLTSGVAGDAHFVTTDNFGHNGSGIMRLRNGGFGNGNNNFSGNFAFGVSSPANSTTGRFSAAGELNLAIAGTVTGEMDTNTAGNIDSSGTSTYPVTPLIVSGTYSIDGSGRSALPLTTSAGTNTAILYVISPTDAFIADVDTQGTAGISPYAGEMLAQTGTFGASSLSGTAVLAVQGASSQTINSVPTVIPLASVGLLTANSANGSFTLAGDTNIGGALSSANQTGNYSVDMNGRVTLSNAGSNPPIFYLVNTNQGYVVGTDGNASSGLLAQQTATSITNASVSGPFAFGTIAPTASSVSLESGIVSFSNGSITGTIDSISTGTLSVSQPLSGSYSIAASGRGTVTVSGANATIFYVISPTTAYVLDANPSDTSPFLGTAEQ